MKKLFLASIAVVALNAGGSALGADLPVKARSLPPPSPPVFVFGWAGLYVGGHGGGAWGDAHYLSDATIGFQQFFRAQTEPEGWLAGGQIGARYQWAPNWVVGL